MQSSKMDGLLHCIKTTRIIKIDNQPHVAKDELLLRECVSSGEDVSVNTVIILRN